MRFFKILDHKFKFASFLLTCLMIAGTVSAQEQTQQKQKRVRQMVEVTLKVVDENGAPINGAQVVIGEGIIHTKTDANGTVKFRGYPDDFVTVSSSSYEKDVLQVLDINNNNTVTLIKSKIYATSSDDVQLPFTTIKKRNMTGSTTVIPGEKLEMYPSTDIRNAFTGLAPGVEVIEKYGAPGVSAQELLGSFGASEKINISARGRTMMVIIDNIPSDLTEVVLDPGEIESVSVIKDITAKALYGPAACDGALFITTKRGSKNEHFSTVNFEQGVSTIDRFPGYVSGAEYANLWNIARGNDGIDPSSNYSPVAITKYAKNDPYDKYFPSINFRDLMLKNNRSFTRANVSSSGGNDIVQYYAYLGYNGEGDIYKIGSKADYNRLTMRSNVDIKLNDMLKLQLDFYGNLAFRRSPNYDYDSDFTSEDSGSNPALSLIELPSVLDDMRNTPPIEFPIWADYDTTNKVPFYGVTRAYGMNPIGGLMGQGYYTETGRNGSTNVSLEYDMSKILKGLKSKTYLGFNVFNLVRIGKAEDYSAYIATPSVSAKTGADTILLTKVHDGVDQANMAKLMDYYYQRFGVFENLTYDNKFGVNALHASLTYYLGKTARNGIEEPERQQNVILTGNYTYNDKYTFLGVLSYSGTYSFAKDKRYSLFPSAGASWIMSEEDFMKNIRFINFLKLRVQGGILGNETFLSPFYYVDRWSVNNSGGSFGAASGSTWFATTTEASVQRASIQRIGNPDLTWEKSKELSVGIDALMLNEKLSFELTYYNMLRDGTITQVVNDLPYMAGISSARPYYNYNKTRYYGLEGGLQFTENFGDFRLSLGGNATIQNTKRIKFDEPKYSDAYQLRTGKPSDAYFGQTYLGRFESDAAVGEAPRQLFDVVLHKGDLQYQDMNGDGSVDESDQSMIGHTTPRLFYALNARFAFRNFDLTLIGTGRAFYDIAMTNEYFWNGWGDNNYSRFVADNLGGDYPRLTYYKVNNNFVGSQFWLRKGGFFKLQNFEVGYNFPEMVSQLIGGRLIRIFARGANVFTISPIKDVDPEAISAGVTNYPLNRTFTGGVKINF